MRYTEIYGAVHQTLNEIMMSPRALKKSVKDIQALAGMEFEMILPNVEGDDDGELESDYDMDRRARSIDDVIEFFEDGDNGISGRQSARLEESLQDAYREWKEEEIQGKWNREGRDYLRDYYFNNEADDEGMLERAREELKEENPDLDTDSEEFNSLVRKRADDLHEEEVDDLWSAEGRIYHRAYVEYYDEVSDEFEESDWLEDSGNHYMNDIAENFDLDWPYLRNSVTGGRSIEEIANSFKQAIGRPVYWSNSYHGARRAPDAYAVEPDSSLEADDPGHGGLEFISPPLPLDELAKDLDKVKKWAESEGAYTNTSTGLHINVSVPDMSAAKLDYVKLAILLGDERVLSEFGRQANTYAESSMKQIRAKVRSDPELAEGLLAKMRERLGALASKAIHSGDTSKYVSINNKDSYIEFRSPGGDWLGESWDLIIPTLHRFVVALDAAMDPQKYRQEYLKKLYKLLSPEGTGDDPLHYFARFAAGDLPKSALKSFVKQLQRGREAKRELEKAMKSGTARKFRWDVVYGNSSIQVVAQNADEAKQRAAQEWGISSGAISRMRARAFEVFDDSGYKGVIWGLVNELTGVTESIVAKTWQEAFDQAQEEYPGKFDEIRFTSIFLYDKDENIRAARENGVVLPKRKPLWVVFSGIGRIHVEALSAEDAVAVAAAREPEAFRGESANDEVVAELEPTGRNSTAKDFWDIEVAWGRHTVQNPIPDPNRTRAANNQPLFYVSPSGQPGKEVMLRANDPVRAIAAAKELRPDIFGSLEPDNIMSSKISASAPKRPRESSWLLRTKNYDYLAKVRGTLEEAESYASDYERSLDPNTFNEQAPIKVSPIHRDTRGYEPFEEPQTQAPEPTAPATAPTTPTPTITAPTNDAPADGSRNMTWNIVDNNGDIMHQFVNRAEQGSANQYAQNWLSNEMPTHMRIRGPFGVVPARTDDNQ